MCKCCLNMVMEGWVPSVVGKGQYNIVEKGSVCDVIILTKL